MATKTESAEIAVLQTQVSSLIESVARIEEKIDNQAGIYVTRGEFEEFKKRWFLSHSISALFGSIVTGISIYVITHAIN